MSHRISVRWVIVFGLLAGTAVAAPAYGPEAFVLTAGEAELFERSFVSDEAGDFVLFVRTGEGIASVGVDLNGSRIVVASDLDQATRWVIRPVELAEGTNELALQLEGEPGSFVTVMVAPAGDRPLFHAGRLVLPWGRSDDEHALSLALKNASRHEVRTYRVLFFGPGGQLVAKSEERHLPPRGSVAFPAIEAMDSGDWTAGSIEVVYSGAGPGRLLGTARQVVLSPTPRVDVQPLVHTGFRPLDDGATVGGDMRRRRAP